MRGDVNLEAVGVNWAFKGDHKQKMFTADIIFLPESISIPLMQLFIAAPLLH